MVQKILAEILIIKQSHVFDTCPVTCKQCHRKHPCYFFIYFLIYTEKLPRSRKKYQYSNSFIQPCNPSESCSFFGWHKKFFFFFYFCTFFCVVSTLNFSSKDNGPLISKFPNMSRTFQSSLTRRLMSAQSAFLQLGTSLELVISLRSILFGL